jgi:DNA-binding GntR family transcriptional regulator
LRRYTKVLEVSNDHVDSGGTPPASLADRAYVHLRDQIITTELPPGSLLQESQLMRRLGIGRTPVREAIQRLRHDGFVTVIPRRGTLVTEINITDLAAIYEVRAHLESWEAGLAAERATAADRVEAAELVDELRALTENDGFPALLALDRRVHRFVYRCGKNDFLAETIDRYHNLSLRILYVAMARYPALTPRLHDVVEDQLQLLDAIIRGDASTAGRIAAAHVHDFESAFQAATMPAAAGTGPRPRGRAGARLPARQPAGAR